MGFLFGVWVGASALGCLAAYAFTHLLTGRLYVPGTKGSGKLLAVDEVAEKMDGWIAKAEEGDDE
jgi:hypothetical protein